MKKIIFLAIFFASFSSVSAQFANEVTATPVFPQSFTQPTPGVVIHNSNVINNGAGVGSQAPRVRTRTVYRDKPLNLTVNILNADTAKKVVETPVVDTTAPKQKDQQAMLFSDGHWFNKLLVTALLLVFILLIFFLLLDWSRRKNTPPSDPAGPSVHTHTHHHNYLVSPSPKLQTKENKKTVKVRALDLHGVKWFEGTGATVKVSRKGKVKIYLPKDESPKQDANEKPDTGISSEEDVV